MSDVLGRLKSALADRYTIERELGGGGMAVVYLAEDLRLERRVAIKVLRPELTSVVAAERFLREIKLTANLHHPHILQLHESGQANGLLYYVMPYVDGESLREKLNREGRLPIDEAVQIAREVADALSYAHSRNLLHRDIKPENILLAEGHAVVADFGIARALSEAGGDRLTDTGVSIGTPVYMSPEQAAGERELSEASDLYSLACVLYEMLTAEPPIAEPSLQKVVSRKLLGDFRPASQGRREVPADVDAVVTRALATEPADRFATVSEFAQALEPARAEPVKEQKRHWLPWAAAAAVVVVAGLSWYVGWGRSNDPESKSIAVLPFENIGGAEENEAFTDGIHDDILTHLYKIGDLKPIARTSVMRYRGTTKSVREVAEELGVATVLEGGVQRLGDRVRINAQLIDPVTEQHLWAETYDSTLTAENIFSIQTDIARRIAAALRTTLSPTAEGQILARPTANLEAYEYYVRAKAALRRDEWHREAIQYLDTAVELDSNFAAAWAELALACLLRTIEYSDNMELRKRGVEALDQAINLAPDAFETLVARASHDARVNDDPVQALEHLRRAEILRPNDADLHRQFGVTLRYLGRWDEALASFEKAAELDPLNGSHPYYLGETYRLLGRYELAERYLDRAIALEPWRVVEKFRVLVRGYGDTIRAREHVEKHPNAWLMAALRYYRRDYDMALQFYLSQPMSVGAGEGTVWMLVQNIYYLTNEQERLTALADSLIPEFEAQLQGAIGAEAIAVARLHCWLGFQYAYLGDREAAFSQAEKCIDASPSDPFNYSIIPHMLAQIYIRTGDYEQAIDQIEIVQSVPNWWSVNWYRIDPMYAPLREHARFQALLKKYE